MLFISTATELFILKLFVRTCSFLLTGCQQFAGRCFRHQPFSASLAGAVSSCLLHYFNLHRSLYFFKFSNFLFTASRLEEENSSKNDHDVTGEEFCCVTCHKFFSSRSRLQLHMTSQHHGGFRLLEPAFASLEPVPQNVLASLSPLSSPRVTSPGSMTSPNAITSSTSASKKERTFRVSQT